MEKDSLRAEPRTDLGPGDIGADLNLRALRVFVAVEEGGSMAVAAKRLGASASAITQQISNLETALGAKLFDRAARPIALTPAGALLRRHAQRILEAVGEARSELMELSLSSLPELRLAIIDDLDASLTPDLVGRLNQLYPRCVLSASSGRSDDLTQALLRRDADVVLTAEPPRDLAAFELFPLLREPFVLVAARGLLDGAQPRLEQLSDAPFVHYSTAMPLGRAIDGHLRRLRMNLPQRFTFDATRSVFAMLRSCRGWTITTPLCVLDGARFRGALEVHPLPFAGFTRTIHLVARRAELGRLPDQLADLCRELIEARLVPAVVEIAPWTEGAFEVLRDPDSPAA